MVSSRRRHKVKGEGHTAFAFREAMWQNGVPGGLSDGVAW